MWEHYERARCLLPLLFLVVLAVVACNAGPETAAENAPVDGSTTIPAPTITPTDTPEPAATPTDTPEPSPVDEPESAVQPADSLDLAGAPSLREYDPAAVEHLDRAIGAMQTAPDPAAGDMGRYDLVIEELNQAIAIQPDFAEAYLMRGMTQMEMAEQQALLLDASLGATLDQAMAHAQVDAMYAFSEKGQWDLVIKDLEQAIAAGPERADLYLQLGTAHMIADLTLALELKPELAEVIENVFNQIVDALGDTN